jgi:hypothetical protein
MLPFLVRSDLWSHTCAISNMPRCSCGSALSTANKRHSAARLRCSAVLMTTPVDALSTHDGCIKVPGWGGRRPHRMQLRASSRGTSVRRWRSLRTKLRDLPPARSYHSLSFDQDPSFAALGSFLVSGTFRDFGLDPLGRDLEPLEPPGRCGLASLAPLDHAGSVQATAPQVSFVLCSVSDATWPFCTWGGA